MIPQPLLWRHITINAKNSWLTGDLRGFRNRGHRIHSTGDYKNPPPRTEHAGLRKHFEDYSGNPVAFEPPLRPLIAHAFVGRIVKDGFTILTVACGEDHLHALAQLPANVKDVKWVVGFAKRAACEAVKHLRRGEMWSAGGTLKIINDQNHQLNTYDYIRARQGGGTFVWTFRGEQHWMGPDGEIFPLTPTPGSEPQATTRKLLRQSSAS